MDGDYLKLDGKWTSDEETFGTDNVASLFSQITAKVSYWSIKHERAAITPPKIFQTENIAFQRSYRTAHDFFLIQSKFT